MPIALRRGQPMPRTYATGAPADPPPFHVIPNGASAAGAPPIRPLTGGVLPLQLPVDIHPLGPRVNRDGSRMPGGVGTDPTDPQTWRRPYVFT